MSIDSSASRDGYDIKVILMAGGKGERLWPKSRISCPKQFTNFIGEKTLIEESVHRLSAFVEEKNLYISSSKEHKLVVQKLFPFLTEKQIIQEPMPKDTACAIALASLKVDANDNDILLFLPADAYIKKEKNYISTLKEAIYTTHVTQHMSLIGIDPTHPSENYGYIQISKGKNRKKLGENVFKVESFREKPNTETAKAYLESRSYLWNSGIFLFSKAKLDKLLRSHVPELIGHLKRYLQEPAMEKALKHYQKIEKISFDYAVVEKLAQINCVKGNFIWDDLGSWNALARNQKRDMDENALSAPKKGVAVNFFNSKNNLVCLDEKNAAELKIVLNGVENLHVILNKNVLYLCNRKAENNIKDILKQLKKQHPEIL